MNSQQTSTDNSQNSKKQAVPLPVKPKTVKTLSFEQFRNIVDQQGGLYGTGKSKGSSVPKTNHPKLCSDCQEEKGDCRCRVDY